MEQLRAVLQQGAITLTLPEAWRTRELTLLPKPHRPLRSPGDLRPIGLSYPAKIVASILAGKLQPFVVAYVKELPQYAYVPQRTLAQALERVLSHCAHVRSLVQQQAQTIHTCRQGKTRPTCTFVVESSYHYRHRWRIRQCGQIIIGRRGQGCHGAREFDSGHLVDP